MGCRFVKIFTYGALLSLCLSFGGGRLPVAHANAPSDRYFVSGDGILRVHKPGGPLQTVRYRRADGTYDPAAFSVLSRTWGTPGRQPQEQLDHRLIEVLDHLQDHFGNAPIVVVSGYRSRTSNNRLRTMKRLAAQSSMHIEAAAADFFLEGVTSSQVATYARELNCCGVGDYGGRTIHVDAGPVRWWDAATSGTESQAPQRNSHVMASTECDRYRAGESMPIRLMRITELPIVVAAHAELECQRQSGWERVATIPLSFGSTVNATDHDCVRISDYPATRSVSVRIPASTAHCERYRIHLRFCERVTEEMPAEIATNGFEIRP